MKPWTKILSRSMIVLSVFTLSGCFVNEVKVTGSLAPTSLGLPSNIFLQNTPTINVQDLDTTNPVDDVSSLSIDLTADCSATYVSPQMMGFAPAVGEVKLDGKQFTAVSSLCVEPTLAQIFIVPNTQDIAANGMSNSDFLKSCTGTDTCENLRTAIFIITDGTNDYGLQLELLGETETSDPLTLLTLVSEGKLEYYGEIITSIPSPSPSSLISSGMTTLLSFDIAALDASKKTQSTLTKTLQSNAVTKALDVIMDPQYWSSDNTLNEAGGDIVFTTVANAMKKILTAKAEIAGDTTDISILDLLDTLNDIEAMLIESMRLLTANRIAAAEAANGNAGQLATASLLLAEGDGSVTAGKTDKAIKRYGDAWNELSGAF